MAVCCLSAVFLSLPLRRESFAADEPGPVAAVLGTARRLAIRLGRGLLFVMPVRVPRPTRVVDREVEVGVLPQLSAALVLLPAGPPTPAVVHSDPTGPAAQSVRRAEACAAS